MSDKVVRTTLRVSQSQFRLIQAIGSVLNVSYAQVMRAMADYVRSDLPGFFKSSYPHPEKLARDVESFMQGVPVDGESARIREKNRKLQDELTDISSRMQEFAHEAQKNKVSSVARKAMNLSGDVLNVRDHLDV